MVRILHVAAAAPYSGTFIPFILRVSTVTFLPIALRPQHQPRGTNDSSTPTWLDNLNLQPSPNTNPNPNYPAIPNATRNPAVAGMADRTAP